MLNVVLSRCGYFCGSSTNQSKLYSSHEKPRRGKVQSIFESRFYFKYYESRDDDTVHCISKVHFNENAKIQCTAVLLTNRTTLVQCTVSQPFELNHLSTMYHFNTFFPLSLISHYLALLPKIKQ